MDLSNFKRFVQIGFPVILFLFFINITGYIERLWLADFSEEALAGGLNGFFLARVFQTACLSVIVVGQSFVGLYHGANQEKNIGPCIWQLVWFSFLSIIFVIPIGLLADRALFRDTMITSSEGGYFTILCFFNFLFPLGNALSAFYFGRGHTRTVVFLTLCACLLNIILDWFLIFGWNFIPPLGATGAALGKVISQAVLCIFLFIFFLSKSNRQRYSTDQWTFLPKQFWHYVRPGVNRALGAFPALGDWVLVSRFMSLKNDKHLLVFSIGSTIFYFLAFVGDGLFQTMVTMASNEIGKKEHTKVWHCYSSGLVLLAVLAAILLLPFFLFPNLIIQCFKSSSFYADLILSFNLIAPWLFLAIIAYGLNALTVGIIVASRDTLFSLVVYCGISLISFVPIYFMMEWFLFPAEVFWSLVMCTNLLLSFIFLWRASKEKWQAESWQVTS